jgi:AcrR family transcriptional regulator
MSEGYSEDPRDVKRAYASTHRERQARETRQRILAAAHDLFTRHGYVATTIEQIATAAGVARPTVFTAVGNKRQIIKLVRDFALAGDEEPVPIPQREWMRRVLDNPDQRQALAFYVENLKAMYGRAAAIELAIEAAADADPEIRDLYSVSLAQRRRGCGLIVKALADKRPLRNGLNVERATDILFALASPALYRLLVHVRKWPPDRYQRWLVDVLVSELLPPNEPRGALVHDSKQNTTG